MEQLLEWIRAERGRLTALASSLGITPSAILQWDEVPAGRVRRVADLTDIPPSILRPDLYEGMETVQ
ncbi:hypothetical protein GN330_22825 [Nitratireductor sp. CAU 1489]|uniref:CI repressor n=1 Tax=Nitratireductor arenosus TaxID=2682096 RepID=A0A844QQ59_9HYPH|nr:helix-turn-helix domain-containing protein [Nitratireductor arenosus]MVB00084.1 hypothetical protein [Nitratireductor arenosus]